MFNLLKSKIKKYLGRNKIGKSILRLMRISQKPIRLVWTRCRRLLGKVDLLYLELTHLCNLRCVGCFTGAGLKKSDELTLEEKRSVIRQAKKMGARLVYLNGSGETLLYKDIFALIDYIRELDMDVTVTTNGTPLNKKMADFLLSRKVHVYFKLWSLDPEIFDQMVGVKNAYRWVDHSYKHDGTLKTLRIPSGLKYLLDFRSKHEGETLVTIMMLITKANYSTLPEVVRFCKETGLPFNIEPPNFPDSAIEYYDDIAPSGEMYRNLYSELVQIMGEGYFRRHRKKPCHVERNPVVWTNGDVRFCASHDACVGNVRTEPLHLLYSKIKRLRRREKRLIARRKVNSHFFRTCTARQYYQLKHGIPCNY